MAVPWERRGPRMNERVDVLRGLMAGDWFEYHGDVLQLDRCKICPTPEKAVPILVAGHADVALRRAARQGRRWGTRVVRMGLAVATAGVPGPAGRGGGDATRTAAYRADPRR